MSLTINKMNVWVPAKDHELSRQFYTELGFDVQEAWGGNYDCRLGAALFRLQKYYVKDWAENFMLQFDVDDARAWYDRAKTVIDSGKFAPARVSEPETVDGALLTHVIDPTGVLLIFIQ